MKRGLKAMSLSAMRCELVVEETSPMKRGLKVQSLPTPEALLFRA